MTGTVTIAIYGDQSPSDATDGALTVADTVGLNIKSKNIGQENFGDDNRGDIIAEYEGDSMGFTVNLSDDRPPGEPVLRVNRLNAVNPKWVQPDTHYQKWMDLVFELVCRLATQLEVDYIAWLNTARDPMASIPEDRPIGEAIEAPPVFGVYTTEVLDDLGGIDSLFDGEPWYVAKLDSDRTLVIESEQPWVEGEWRPPTDGYIEDAEFRDETEKKGGFDDPFTVLRHGEYGTDAVVAKDDIGPAFTNEALTLERVYRDESDNLRRIADDSFVRRLIGDDGPIGELPEDADPDDERVSALIEGSIPPSFVRLEDPDDETVVSKAMTLDIETSKFELLVSLAQTAHSEDVSQEVIATIEEVLDELHEMDDQDGIDQYVEANLL